MFETISPTAVSKYARQVASSGALRRPSKSVQNCARVAYTVARFSTVAGSVTETSASGWSASSETVECILNRVVGTQHAIEGGELEHHASLRARAGNPQVSPGLEC